MTKLRISLFAVLIAIGLHTYLAFDYYPLKFAGSTGDSACNINTVFNCDTVAASKFSTFLGIPMAAWGLSANLVFLTLLLLLLFRLTDDRPKTERNSFYVAFLIGLASVVMGAISLIFLNTYCLFCIGAYICSFVTLATTWSFRPRDFLVLKQDLLSLGGANKTFLIMLICIPAISFFFHNMMLGQHGGENLKQVVNSSFFEWEENPKFSFDLEPSLSMGPDRSSAKMVISEFADFLCGHCKFAATPLHAFTKGRSDVRLEFYSFALDGECNSVIDQAVGAPCLLAKANYCSNKIQMGWTLHDLFFSEQAIFQESRTADGALERIKKLWTHDTSKWNELVSCIEDPKTIENVKLQAKLGENSGVKGTPTIYVNGKKLPRGQLLPVLEKVYSEL